VISLLYLGRPRDAMTFGAPETEALCEGSAQKGFGDPSLDGSPVPLGSTATSEPIEIPRSLWGRWKSLDDHRDAITSLWVKKQSNTNKLIPVTINDHRGTSGERASLIYLEPEYKAVSWVFINYTGTDNISRVDISIS
jgi:hypothetical protein